MPWVVNARHVKAVPGRKTDVADAQWLASLARAGLLRASFIAKADLRSLRHIARPPVIGAALLPWPGNSTVLATQPLRARVSANGCISCRHTA